MGPTLKEIVKAYMGLFMLMKISNNNLAEANVTFAKRTNELIHCDNCRKQYE